MKRTLLTLSIAIASHFCYAQWNPGSGIITTTDNVGIGTTSPNALLSLGASVSTDKLFIYDAGDKYGFGVASGEFQMYSPAATSHISFGTRNSSSGAFTGNVTILNSGNMGVGTTSPGAKLEVNGNQILNGNLKFATDQTAYFINGPANGGAIRFRSNSASGSDRDLQFGNIDNNDIWASYMTVAQGGNVGIGAYASNTMATYDIKFNVQSNYPKGDTGPHNIAFFGTSDSANPFGLAITNQGENMILQTTNIGANGLGSLAINAGGGMRLGTGTIDVLNITPTGNMGIGTSIPDEKLTVNGTIHSTEVKVTSTVPAPDYVFDPEYKLTELTELKDYLDKNHHLPEIPSAAQIEKEGISLGDMNMKLLKKVEELTLYLIEKDDQLIQQRQNNQSQQDQINELKQQLIQITKTLTKN